MLTSILSISLGAILINNFIMSQFLGCCPFFGVSKKIDTAVGMGMAVTFVMGLASAVTYLINNFILVPLGLEFMQTVAFILVIATLVQFVEMFLMKSMPALYQALGVFLPLITTNCAVLGVCITNIDEGYNYIQALVNSFGAGVGFLLAMVIFSGMRKKIDDNPAVPKAFQGSPIVLVTAALLSLAFMGFGGLV